MQSDAEKVKGGDTHPHIDDREVVKKQRELKRKKDALRKLEKKVKNPDLDPEALAAAQAEIKELIEFISAAEGAENSEKGGGGEEGTKKKKGKPTSDTVAETPAEKKDSKEVPTEDVEKSKAELRLLVEKCLKESASPSTLKGIPKVSAVHPRVAETTLLMEEMLIVGGNARTMSMISAFRELVKETTTLSAVDLKNVDTAPFEKLVEVNFEFMKRKRTETIGMRYVKESLVRRFVAARDALVQQKPLPFLTEEITTARGMASAILDAIESELELSMKSIVEDRSIPYVSPSDTILVFGRSSIVEFILLSRARTLQRKPKRVIVLDSAPLFEGRELAKRLAEVNINITYGLLTSCCTLMSQCTRVFIGASTVLQNGDVYSRCGTALVAACAKSFQKPVLCFAESYKFEAEVWLGILGQNTKLMDMRPDQGNHTDGSRSPLIFSTPTIVHLQSVRGAHLGLPTFSCLPLPPGICTISPLPPTSI